jgi:hypothetical protein
VKFRISALLIRLDSSSHLWDNAAFQRARAFCAPLQKPC